MPGYEIRSIRKAAAVLRVFSAQRPELGVAEIARVTGLNRSVVQKIAVTLAAERFLRKPVGAHRYEIGPAVLEIAGSWLNSNPLVREGRIVLRELVRDSGMSGGLGVLEGEEVLYLEAVEAEVAVKATSRVGDRRPLHVTATGKCILAFLPEAERDNLLARIRLAPFTLRTTTDLELFRQGLALIAERGYALTRGERVPGLAGVAAPVWDYRERVVAAISLAIPEILIDTAGARCVELTVHAGAELSARLGRASAGQPK